MDSTALTADDPADEGAPSPVMLRVTGWSLVRGVMIVAAGLVTLGVMLTASTVLWWLAIATAAAGLLYPAMTWLRRWMPAWAAIITVLVAALAVIGLVGYRGSVELTHQFEVIRDNAVATARSVQSTRQFGQVATEFGLVDKTTAFFRHLPVVLGGDSADPAATAQSAASSGSALFAIATFAILLLIFGPRFVGSGLAQIDDERVRARIGKLVVDAYHASARYVWLMAGRAVLVGIIGGLVCALFGLETPTALGVLFAALSLIPGLGIVLASLPIAAYLMIDTPARGIILLAAAVVLQAVEASHGQRRIEASSVHVGPAATLVAALFGLQLYGLGGMLVGLAIAVYSLAVLRNLTDSHDEVLAAVRELVREDVATDVEVTVGEGSTVIADDDATVIVEDDDDAGDDAEAGPASGGREGDGVVSP
jgi:predicted PurR-regulated permease PerM